MKYLNGLEPGPLPLMSLARLQIRKSLGPRNLNRHIEQLALPTSIKHFMRYEERFVTADDAAETGEN
jgi:SPRY domain-containing SOCS box protein 1/4